jgi:MFS family permease
VARVRLRTFYLHQASANCLFFQPIFFVFYERIVGMSVPAILWLQSYNLALRALLELPMGALADRWSRRGCLVASALAVAAGAAVLLVAPSLGTAILAETAFSMANALRSGADSALLYDALASERLLARYPEAEGRLRAMASLGAAVTAVAGGFLAATDLRWPYAAAVATSIGAALVASRLPEQRHAPPDRAQRRRLMREAVGIARADVAVRWTIALAALAVVSSHVYYFLQQPYLAAIGVPVWAFGVVFAGTKVVTAATAAAAHRLDATLEPRRAAIAMLLVPVLGLAAMAGVHRPAGALLVASRGVLDGLWEPLLNVYMNRLAPSRLRATLLSLQNLSARLALALTLAGLGVVTGAVGVHGTLAIAAVATAICGAALVSRYRSPGCRTDVV